MAEQIAYFDHNATTPLDRGVLEAMSPYFVEVFGNPASRNHHAGQRAAEAVELARANVARLINAQAKEIVWTSGATESNNLAIFGVVAFAKAESSGHVITQLTEHLAVRDSCRELEQRGVDITWLEVDSEGRVDPQSVHDAIRPETSLVSIMVANNETGTIQQIREIGHACKEAGVLFHTDAAQAIGKIPIDVEAECIDLMSLSSHKIYGPKGVGALYVRSKNPRVKLRPMLFGGGHERGYRSGSINVPGVVGFGEACRIAAGQMSKDSEGLTKLRDRLERGIQDAIEGVHVNGCPASRLAHVSNLRFEKIEAESLLMMLEGVAASTGSACSSLSIEPSHVLIAMGLSESEAFGSVRFSLGRSNTDAQVDLVIQRVVSVVKKLRQLNPAYSPQL